MAQNRVGFFRSQKGLSLLELSREVGVSRQSLHAIENGEQVPKVYLAMSLAKALGVEVGEVFPSEPEGSLRVVESSGRNRVFRACITDIGGETIVREPCSAGFGSLIAPADAVVRYEGGLCHVESESGRSGLFIDGCDPVLGIISTRSSEAPALFRVRWFYGSNRDSLASLRSRSTHCALVHEDVSHISQEIGEAEEALAVPFGEWELALCFAPGNPKKIVSLPDIARHDVKFALREEGSGVRHFVEEVLNSAGVGSGPLEGSIVFHDHFQVAAAVKFGLCDAGVVPISIAQSMELDSVSVGLHQSSLVFSRDGYDMALAGGLFDLMASKSFAREVAALGGYRLVS